MKWRVYLSKVAFSTPVYAYALIMNTSREFETSRYVICNIFVDKTLGVFAGVDV